MLPDLLCEKCNSRLRGTIRSTDQGAVFVEPCPACLRKAAEEGAAEREWETEEINAD